MLSELRALAAGQYVPAYTFALIHNGLEEQEEALIHLEQSFREREVQLTCIRIDTRWDNLRAEARVRSIAERMHLE